MAPGAPQSTRAAAPAGHATKPDPPRTSPSPVPALPGGAQVVGRSTSVELADNVFEREAGAHLDELALVAALVRPDVDPMG